MALNEQITIEVSFDKDWEEYQVNYIFADKIALIGPLTYHTDDKEDAELTKLAMKKTISKLTDKVITHNLPRRK